MAQGLSIAGVVPIRTMADLQAEERKQAEAENQQPVLQGLAGHVRRCWEASKRAKLDVEQRMLKSVRARRGMYDPDKEAEIKKFGGSTIYMMLTSNKCRAAGSWLKDVLLSSGDERPWTVKPTTLPTLSPDVAPQIVQFATQEAMQTEQALQMAVGPEAMYQIVQRVKDRVVAEQRTAAKAAADRMADKMEDQLTEGGYREAMAMFLDDITTFPAAIMKGPVVRKKPRLQWVQGTGGTYTPQVQDTLVMEWERVDPFNIYPAPHCSDIDDGYLIEHHRLTRRSLQELIGVDGYSEAAIRAVLDEHGIGGLREWLAIDTEKADAEGKGSTAASDNPDVTIDALQYWGHVQGKMLVEWGMSKDEITDELLDYPCEVWLIGRWVIKATLNYDPTGSKPYYRAAYEEIPGAFWGNSVADLVRDCQDMCNAAARALANNMGISSGPQVSVLSGRLPPGEDVTQMFPWKIWQFVDDLYGSTAKPIDFFQPDIHASELMAVYERFSNLADEYSGVPRYMAGDASGQGALRTSSGISMLMTNAGKSIKQVVNNVDRYVLEKLLTRLYFHNMKYGDDPTLKGDVQMVARGASMIAVKEQAQVRRNEYLQLVLSSPIAMGIVGEEAVAALLREGAKLLDMDTDKIVPAPEIIRARAAMAQQMQLQAMGAGGPGAPQLAAPKTMPANGQQLATGVPVTDNFAPRRQA